MGEWWFCLWKRGTGGKSWVCVRHMLNLRTFLEEQVGNRVGRWTSVLNSAGEKPQLEA